MIEQARPSEVDAILDARAAKLAARKDVVEIVEEKTHVSVITVGAETFAVPTRYLSCVVKSPRISPLPKVPEWFRGIAQIRGELVCAVDIGLWFAVSGKTRQAFLMVLEHRGKTLGLLIDTAGGFRDIGRSDISETFDSVGRSEHPILATTKDVVTILDIPKMFTNPDLVVGAAAGGAR